MEAFSITAECSTARHTCIIETMDNLPSQPPRPQEQASQEKRALFLSRPGARQRRKGQQRNLHCHSVSQCQPHACHCGLRPRAEPHRTAAPVHALPLPRKAAAERQQPGIWGHASAPRHQWGAHPTPSTRGTTRAAGRLRCRQRRPPQ
jgi:hypothetical protein